MAQRRSDSKSRKAAGMTGYPHSRITMAASGRPLRRRLTAAVSASAAIAAIAAAWPLLAAHAAAGAPALSVAPQARVPACSVRTLRARAGGVGLYQGLVQYELRVVNTGSARCAVRARPPLTGLASNGARVTVRYMAGTRSPGLARSGSAITLRPGQYAYTILSSPAWCAAVGPGERVMKSLSVHVGRGAVTDSRWLRPIACGVPEAMGFAIEQKPAPAIAPLVTATLTAPFRATAGSTISYTVRITSTSGGLVALRPCPAFQVRLFAANARVSATGRLSCPARFLTQGHTITLDERLTIPASARGVMKLLWATPGFGGVTAGRPIDIRS
jgi:hypothetical protein